MRVVKTKLADEQAINTNKGSNCKMNLHSTNKPSLKKIICVIGVLRRTFVCYWRFDRQCGSHFQSQVTVVVSRKFKNPGEWVDWSIDRVAVGKCIMWLAVKTCERGYANRWVVKWIINNVLLFRVESTSSLTLQTFTVNVCKVREEVDFDLGQFVRVFVRV